jgi:hypothetical protein
MSAVQTDPPVVFLATDDPDAELERLADCFTDTSPGGVAPLHTQTRHWAAG